jgi:hypothetical protein
LAESPSRYCGNCGHEFSSEDQFCRNCGSPAHQAARVPTPEADVPEADVPVPPPPQAEGAGGAAAPQPSAQEEWRRRHPVLTGSLAVVALLIILIIIGAAFSGGGDETAGGGGGGGGQQDQPAQQDQGQRDEGQQGQAQEQQGPELYLVGETAKVGNVEWRLTDAYYTTQLKSDFGTQKRGNFVVVDFTFTNNRDEEVTLDPELHMTLKDGTGREFGTDPDAFEFVPTRLNIFLKPVNPGISQDGRVVYEVPPDAEGFTLTVDDVEFMEDKSARYDLGNLRPGTFNSASPAATATATATARQ